MKPLKLSFLLLLVVSVLFLSGANIETLKESNPSEKEVEQSKKTEQNAEDKHTATKATAVSPPKTKAQELQDQAASDRKTGKEKPYNYIFTDDPITVFTGLIAIFSFFLFITGAIEAYILYSNFIVEHRPRVKIRNVYITSEITNRDSLYNNGVEIRLTVVNWGGSPAKIVRACIGTVIDKPKQPAFMKKPLVEIDTSTELDNKSLKPSKEYIVHWQHPARDSKMLMILNRDTFEKGVPPESFYVIGYFVYRDWLRRHYKTHFCRRFDTESEQFVVVDHPDYEYAD